PRVRRPCTNHGRSCGVIAVVHPRSEFNDNGSTGLQATFTSHALLPKFTLRLVLRTQPRSVPAHSIHVAETLIVPTVKMRPWGSVTPQPTFNSHCAPVLWLARDMPRRELKHPHQVEDWLLDLGRRLAQPGDLILIGSGGLLWHAYQRGLTEPLPENSMDVDP